MISVVIPTCNRKLRLLSLLGNLDRSSYPIEEVIIVDSGDEKLSPSDHSSYENLKIIYTDSERSVCIQRNKGIQLAHSPWIFLCDDDIEIPADYLGILVNHIHSHSDAGAASGQWMQKEKNGWTATYPENSARMVFWKFFFQLSVWGEIDCSTNNVFVKKIKNYYKRKGNHVSKAGWPVLTDFSGEYFVAPVYSLGASLVKKEWLIHSPFDEVLDPHVIGDNYGVIVDFPSQSVHVIKKTFVYHHREPMNRLKSSLQYYRRVLALDYFSKTKKNLSLKRIWLLWSLTGNLLYFILSGKSIMSKAALKVIWKIAAGQNPYLSASRKNKKVVEPLL